jgi:hypothetical protein
VAWPACTATLRVGVGDTGSGIRRTESNGLLPRSSRQMRMIVACVYRLSDLTALDVVTNLFVGSYQTIQ